MKIETILTPAELPALAQRDLRATACVVFDVLRATSTFVTALHHGAKAIIPVSEIAEALEIQKSEARSQKPESILLGGERNGVRISADGVDFELGNSPREFTPEKVRGKTIVSTTTNGTRALRACVGAKIILASAFLNLSATAEFLRREKVETILLVCAGTGINQADEDVLAAGALVELLVGSSRCDDRTAQRAVLTHYSSHSGTGPEEMMLLKGVLGSSLPSTPQSLICHHVTLSGTISASGAGKSSGVISPTSAHAGLSLVRAYSLKHSGISPA